MYTQRALALEQHSEALDEVQRNEREENTKREEEKAIQEIKRQHTVSRLLIHVHVRTLCENNMFLNSLSNN